MTKRFTKASVIFAVTLSLGLHWALLQSVAWTGMFLGYAQTSSFQEAFIKTFDGNNPCQLCKAVSEGQQSENRQEFTLPLMKIEALPCVTIIVLAPQKSILIPVPLTSIACIRAESPPIPPPELA